MTFLLSLVVYGRISDTVSGSGQPQAETPAIPSKAAPPPLRQKNNDNLAGNLADYVILHETRDASISLHSKEK